MKTSNRALPKWLCVWSMPYMLATVTAVLAPELLIAGLWLAGVRPERVAGSYMWPGNWGWGVLLAYSVSLIFGWAFILGVALRNAVVSWFVGWRASIPGWLLVSLCIGFYAAHLRGYVGWVHLIQT